MMASLFAGVSGLKNHQVRMNIVGDNISNINTIGFKLGRVTFQEALVQTLRGAARPTTTSGGTNPLQLGLGMSLASIDNIFQQGGLETTGQVTDLAIQGNGFFILSDGEQMYFTRAGAFGFDANSNMVNPANGLIVQGRMADQDGIIQASTPIGNIVLPFGQQEPARATENLRLGMNLNATGTNSTATLTSTGTSNVTNVTGQAVNGSGGVHTITITGQNAAFSQLAGTHARVLTDASAAAGHFSAAAGGAGGNFTRDGGVPGTDDYIYAVIAVNGLGHTQYIDETTVTVNAGEVVTINWAGYPDIADATSIQIYRRYTGTQYGESNGDPTENGLVAEIDLSTIDPATNLPVTQWVDDGSTSLRIAEPYNTNSTTTITGDEQLSAFGVTNASNLQISVDNGEWVTLTQLTPSSTLNDLVARINSSVNGVTASIVNSQLEIKRDYAGDPSAYNVRLRDVTYSNELTDFGAGHVTTTPGAGGSGSLPDATTYYYAFVGVNSRGETKAYVYDETTTAASSSIDLDWTAYVAAEPDVASVKIYRGTLDNSDPNNPQVIWDGLISHQSVTAGTTFTDTGVATTSGTPLFVNSTTPNICEQIFGGPTFNVNNGVASTLEAIDVFTPNITGLDLDPIVLSLVTDPSSGLITGVSDIGGGGITVSTGNGGLIGDPDGTGPLTSSTLIITTEDTQHATSITAYDSQGGKHTITITFTKSWLDNEWFWDVSTGGTEVVRSGSSGRATFNSDGSLGSFTIDGGGTQLVIDPNNGSQQMNIIINAGTPGTVDGLTSFSSTSTASIRSQDGYGLGVLSNINIDQAGNVTGMFTNGVSRLLAQIYIAELTNPAGMQKVGKNMYQVSANSGEAILSSPEASTSTSITSGALEISNVDMAQEFTSMIVSQRGFQANARVITTSDDMLSELVNLKR
jgi:flagellar hook-basal body protein